MASGPCTSTGWKQGAELWWMILIMLSSMIVMEFLPKVPKPKDIMKKPVWLRPLAGLVAVLLELPSSLISIVLSIVLENFAIRPAGFRTDTIGDIQEFTAADAAPRIFFLDDSYDYSRITDGDNVSRIFTQGLLLCAVGCIESLMTAEVVSSFTKTPHHSGLVVGAMGVGNIISGFLGGMGGNAMIGLSTIACLNKGKGRIAPLTTALGILICVSAAYEVLNYIPMAALAGIMIVVVLHTFKWFSLPLLLSALLPSSARACITQKNEALPTRIGCFSMERKIVRSDVLVMLVVSVLVVITNIVLAVAIGLGLSCAAFAWEAAFQLRVSYHYEADSAGSTTKIYEVDGPLFFATSKRLNESFSPAEDPPASLVVFSQGVLFDYSLMDTLVAISKRYQAEGKKIEFRKLTTRSIKMIKKAHVLTKQLTLDESEITDLKPPPGMVPDPPPTRAPPASVTSSSADDIVTASHV
jgi:SulP family sulfate permease